MSHQSLIFPFFDLPLEIREIILNFIYEQKDILASRRTCLNLYNFFKSVPVYCEAIEIGRYHFSKSNFRYEDFEGNLISIIEFGDWGQWKHTEYSPQGLLGRTIRNKKFFQTEMLDYTDPTYNRFLTNDARYGLIKEKKIPKLIHPGNCIIS